MKGGGGGAGQQLIHDVVGRPVRRKIARVGIARSNLNSDLNRDARIDNHDSRAGSRHTMDSARRPHREPQGGGAHAARGLLRPRRNKNWMKQTRFDWFDEAQGKGVRG